MLSDLNWKRSNVRTETQCSRCTRPLLAGQSSIQIDRSRVCIQCWDEVRADPTKSAAEYKRELKIGAGSAPKRASSTGRSNSPRRPAARTEPALSPYDASLHVGNVLDRATEGTPAAVLTAKDFDFHEPGFDNIVVGRAGVTIVSSRVYSSNALVEVLASWTPANLLINGRNMHELIDLAVEQRNALEKLVTDAKFKFDVPVSAALCFETVTGIDRTPVRDIHDVHIDTAENIAKHVVRRGPVFEEEVEQVIAYLRGDVAAPDAAPATD